MDGDPGKRLLMRLVLVGLIGGFVLLELPSGIVGMFSGTARAAVGSAVGAAFYGWLTWRLVAWVRSGRSDPGPRHQAVSAIGYTVVAVSVIALQLWDALRHDYSPRSIPFAVIVVVLTAATWLAAARSRPANAQPS